MSAKRGENKSNITLLLAEPEFRYLTTIMQMYVDNGKAYIQVATGALLLPIVFLRNLLGLSDHDALRWIPGPMWISWILLLLSIGAGLGYQVKAVGYLEKAMEGGILDAADDNARISYVERWTSMIPREPGFIFDLMAFTFYLGTMFFVIGAVEVRHYHWWIPYTLCPAAVLLTFAGYKAL
jgi:hypothetical protein